MPEGTKLTFETASFADSIRKASLAAPSHGQAFDKAAGILLEVTGDSVTVKSTNTDVYRTEWITAEKVEGHSTVWRLPSALFASVLSKLPIGTGRVLTLEEKTSGLQRYVQLISNRTKARFNLISHSYYPLWDRFDPAGLTETIDLGGRLEQIEWAAAKSGTPFCGVHFDGALCIATDRYRLATAPLVIPGLAEPVTVPAGLLGQLLRQTGEIKVGVSGGQFLCMPDEQTQLRCVTFGDPYPNTSGLRKRTGTTRIKVRKTALLSILERAHSYGSSDRDSALRVFFGEEEIAVVMANAEQGLLGDAIEISGYAVHDRLEIRFSAKGLIEAITHAPSEEIELGYELTNPLHPLHIDGGSGYLAWVQPRKEV
jgi:DNA polymerase III sliding clamp (beta) subunit (PCNA family)